MMLLAGDWLPVALAFGVGACVGSFLNVCIHRLPAYESVVRPGSRCPHCRAPIAWHDNIPVVSWLWLRARCRRCGVVIAARYPLVEIVTGVLGIAVLIVFGPTARAAVAFVFAAALLLVSVIDLDHRFIPDEVSLPGILVGIAAAFLPGRPTPLDAALGAALGGGVLWAVAWTYERTAGVEGMGLGDVKMLAMVGAFLGWQGVIVTVFLGSLVGAVVGLLLIAVGRLDLGSRLPFGVFLAGGAMVALFAGPALIARYSRLL
jgi:leader peptidase (prepilin peptidase)/N-methyltransferase